MRNLVICYFIFKNQSHCSGVRGQKVKSLGEKKCGGWQPRSNHKLLRFTSFKAKV